ncbi:MFS transporter [Gloeobacter kilaueensis]|uniref:Major facilitator superfamily MFS_1 n=1 Tax=Gloeobacter kilaueensis (strain ATCC BAA-2537 / CCAP 1431/1 / ULC 316 / JS1) TaxID=1183438 RepID=U5QMZ7_GLOK1|nr:MFS transporter [Gloeobacter kilaueensis]AGY60337.1 major facilitator superfamily MFS_1 [Gloeobacter kilaueensis JS1]
MALQTQIPHGPIALWQFFSRPTTWKLCLGRWCSDWGDAVHILAFNWLVVRLSGSAAAVGLCQALWLMGQLAGSWPGGWLVDRLSARTLLLLSYALHALTIGGFAVLAFRGEANIWLLAALSVFLGMLGAPGDPANRSLMKQAAASDDELARLNGLLSSGGAVAQCLGPLLGGWLLTSAPLAWAFVLNTLSFVAAGLLLLGIRSSSPVAPKAAAAAAAPAGESLFAQIRPLLPSLIAASGFVFGPAALLVLFLPYYVQQVQHWPISALGVLEAARWLGLGIGTIGGSLAIGRLARRVEPAIGIAMGTLVVPLVGFNTHHAANWWVQSLWLVAVGTSAGVAYVCLNQLFLERVRGEWIGRVNGALAVYVGVGLLLFGALWWQLIDHLGYSTAFSFAIGGFALALAAALAAKYFSLDNRPQES